MIMKIIRNSIAFFSSILLSASISISAYCQTPNHFPIEDAIQTKEAGHHKDFNPAVFKKKFEDYITKEAALTPQEAQIVLPLFHQMKTQQRNIQGMIYRACKRGNLPNLSEKDAAIILKEVVRLQKQSNNLEITYYERISKAICEQKVLRIMEAEHRFNKHIFRKMAAPKE